MTHPLLNDPRLAPLLALLLPGGAGFPSAAELGLTSRIADDRRLAEAMAGLLDALPPRVGPAEIAAVERARPEVFGPAIVAVYSAYYTHPQVLAVIEAATGYRAAPPQPEGYAMPPFDPAMLAVPAARGSHWRDPRADTTETEPEKRG
ncbi:MAG: hypothetical protein AAGG09_13905 [Pseudomonadota bacterium]